MLSSHGLHAKEMDRAAPSSASGAEPTIALTMSALSILIVCYGNTCRSPMAAGALRRALADRDLSGVVQVSSAGIAVRDPGGPADPRAIRATSARGIDIAGHRRRQLSLVDVEAADLVLAVDKAVETAVRALATGGSRARDVRLLLSFTRIGSYPVEVGDPYLAGTQQAYEEALDLIVAACAGLADAVASGRINIAARPTC